MSLYLVVYGADELDELDGLDVGRYSDFGRCPAEAALLERELRENRPIEFQ
jgi:hypothetical protein